MIVDIELLCSNLLVKVKVEDVVDKLNLHQRREKMRVAQQKFRINLKQKATFFITNVWEFFPKSGWDKLKAFCLCNRDLNYGGHQLSLGFDLAEDECAMMEDYEVGTRSLGLRYENEHTVRLRGREMCLFSEKHFDFLQAIHSSIFYQYPKLRRIVEEFMRVNMVLGAMSGPHTDTMRGATPNFMMVESPRDDGKYLPFTLAVRLFPNFKTSVVLLDGKTFIPHKLKRSHLILIGLENNKPHYYVYPAHTIERLEPYGDLDGCIVVGIKKNKLQVMSDEYKIYQSTSEMPLLSVDEILAIAKEHKATKPYRMFMYLSEPLKWHKFFGWKHAHHLLKGCDHRVRRLHVFYRPVREETSAARIRTQKKDNKPINYTFMEGATHDEH